MTHSQVAASVRKRKESHPELYCKSPKCLFRLTSGGDYCPKHTPKVPGSNLSASNRAGETGADSSPAPNFHCDGAPGAITPPSNTCLDITWFPTGPMMWLTTTVARSYVRVFFAHPERVQIEGVRFV
jgi:hypothetical protein